VNRRTSTAPVDTRRFWRVRSRNTAAAARLRLEGRLGAGVGELPQVVPRGDATPAACEVVGPLELGSAELLEVERGVEHRQGTSADELWHRLRERPPDARDAAPLDHDRLEAVVELAQRHAVTGPPVARTRERRLGAQVQRRALGAVEDEGTRPDADRVGPVGEEREPRGASSGVVVDGRLGRGRRAQVEDSRRGAQPLSARDRAPHGLLGQSVLPALVRGGQPALWDCASATSERGAWVRRCMDPCQRVGDAPLGASAVGWGRRAGQPACGRRRSGRIPGPERDLRPTNTGPTPVSSAGRTQIPC
jgi:hypothetical protein